MRQMEAMRPRGHTACQNGITPSRLLQPRGPNYFGVFLSHARETIDFYYERKLYQVSGKNVPDPRVTHIFTVAADPFGNVLETVAVGYGRRYPDSILFPPTRPSKAPSFSVTDRTNSPMP
jgi:hypothetical protein